MRSPEWETVFPFDPARKCEACQIRLCEWTPEQLKEDPPTLQDGTTWGCCPPRALRDDQTTTASLLRGLKLWRYWDKGNLAVTVRDATDGLCELMLAFDEEKAAYKAVLEERAYVAAKREAERNHG